VHPVSIRRGARRAGETLAATGKTLGWIPGANGEPEEYFLRPCRAWSSGNGASAPTRPGGATLGVKLGGLPVW
jgi:hypothetical protein